MPFNHWELEIDLSDFWKNEDLSAHAQIEAVFNRINTSDWREITKRPFELEMLISELDGILGSYDEGEITEAELVDDFDELWSGFYDLADVDRVWLNTVS